MKIFTAIVATAVAVVSAGFAAPGEAAIAGPRVGVSSDPDQIVGGIHWNYGDVARNVRLTPVVELGLGDDVIALSANADVTYEFSTSGRWGPYLGGEISVFYYNFDRPSGFRGDDDDVSAGLSLAGGVRTVRTNGNELSLDLRLGLTNRMPDFRAVVGWTF